jgi:hypothetical protein
MCARVQHTDATPTLAVASWSQTPTFSHHHLAPCLTNWQTPAPSSPHKTVKPCHMILSSILLTWHLEVQRDPAQEVRESGMLVHASAHHDSHPALPRPVDSHAHAGAVTTATGATEERYEPGGNSHAKDRSHVPSVRREDGLAFRHWRGARRSTVFARAGHGSESARYIEARQKSEELNAMVFAKPFV